jgi:hypothetical protein
MSEAGSTFKRNINVRTSHSVPIALPIIEERGEKVENLGYAPEA